LLIWAVSLARRGKTRDIRTAAVLALPVMALGVYEGNGLFGGLFAPVYYWFCVAALAMAEFEQRQARAARLAQLRASLTERERWLQLQGARLG
jgi:hypothetical protein